MKNYQTFISPEELNKIINNENLVIIDCRFDLLQPDWGKQDYLQCHIPTAVYADLDKHLSRKVTIETGRHPLPEPEKFFEKCSNWGIDEKKQVVVYDTTSGSFAARLWWLLKYYDHKNVAILDGGFSKWKNLGYPTEVGNVTNRPAKFHGNANNDMLVTTEEMEKIISDPNYSIIDARSMERYLGIQEPIDTIAGRIPNSLNFFHQNNLNDQGMLLSDEILEEKYKNLLKNKENTKKVVYCGSGVTSCLNVAVMQHLGIEPVKLYVGSWSEWIRNTNHPMISENNS